MSSRALICAVCLLIAFAVGGCGGGDGAAGSTAALPDTPAAKTYSSSCASCHGDRGQGRTAGAFTSSELTRPEILDVITNGKPRMPAFGEALTATQIDELADLVLSLSES